MFDATEYVRPVRANVVGALALMTLLLRRVAKDDPEGVRAAAKDMRACLNVLRTGWHQRRQTVVKGDLRAPYTAYSNAWGGLRDRVEAWTRLSAAGVPQVSQAARVVSLIFPNGTSFLKGDSRAQWLEGDRLLEEIRRMNLKATLDELAGEPFLAEVERAHDAYGEALGMTREPAPEATPVGLQDPLRDAIGSVAAYALQVAASVRRGDPVTAERAHHLLKPILDHRKRSRSAPSAQDAAGEEPVDGGEPVDTDAVVDGAPANDDATAPRAVSRVA